jgi:hypothetical protein
LEFRHLGFRPLGFSHLGLRHLGFRRLGFRHLGFRHLGFRHLGFRHLGYSFVQLGFNFSNRVTDTLESSSILIYFSKHMSLYTRSVGRMPQ